MSRFTFTLSHESIRGVKTEVTKTFAAEQLEYILSTPPLCHDKDVRKWGETVSRMNKDPRKTVVLEQTSSFQPSPKPLSSKHKKRKPHHNKWENQPRINGRFVKSDRKGKAPITFVQPASSHGTFSHDLFPEYTLMKTHVFVLTNEIHILTSQIYVLTYLRAVIESSNCGALSVQQKPPPQVDSDNEETPKSSSSILSHFVKTLF